MSKKKGKRLAAAIAAVSSALEEVEKRFGRTQGDVETVKMNSMILKIRRELEGMLDELLTGQVSGTRGGYGRTIVDSWSWDDPLGGILVEAEQKYLAAGR